MHSASATPGPYAWDWISAFAHGNWRPSSVVKIPFRSIKLYSSFGAYAPEQWFVVEVLTAHIVAICVFIRPTYQ